MKITQIGSKEWQFIVNLVKFGGVNIPRLLRLTDTKQPNEAAEVTISQEAKDMYNRHLEESDQKRA